MMEDAAARNLQNVLIVDDVPANIRILEQLLRDSYEIRVTTRGAEALEIAESDDPPDLILLDIIMPEMDGYEVCRRLLSSRRARHIPVIFITSRSEEDEEARGFALGAVDYITKPFSPEIVRARVKTQMDLKRYRDHLRHSNERLRQEIKKQEISIDLAKKILACVNGAAPRNIPLNDGANLFVEAVSIPCNAEGGDHYFVRQTPGPTGPGTLISLKDQSGHEVGCILRSIISDLAHSRLAGEAGGDLENQMSRLNDRICRSGALGGENFFTAITGRIDHADLTFRFVSAGHPPFMLIRGDSVTPAPAAADPGANIPVGIADGVSFTAGELPLRPGDRLIFYTDGLTEMPLKRGGAMLNTAELALLIQRLAREKPAADDSPAGASNLMYRLLEAVARLSGETILPPEEGRKGVNSSDDDVTLLCMEVEKRAFFAEDTLHPGDWRDLCRIIDAMRRKIMAEMALRGFFAPRNAFQTVLEEVLVNAWIHGNGQDPRKAIALRRRFGNDFHLEVTDEGPGFDPAVLPDPTVRENLTRTSGRGVFLIRYLADEVRWTEGGRRIHVIFHRRRVKDDYEKSPVNDTMPSYETDTTEERGNSMEIAVKQENGSARFEISGKIDETGAETLKQRFREINQPDLKNVVFDFRNVSHIGSAGIGKLLLFYKDLALKGGQLKIQNASQTVYELFTVLKLDTIFSISRS